ncbi:MAG: hypothetical protein LBG44_09010 [Gemmatimonadota bacterium]|nr:hypothetical protein [Gemmatimonadota bacterium]
MRFIYCLPLALSLMVFSAGCSDSTGTTTTLSLVTDTVTVYAPDSTAPGRPTAVDITTDGAFGIVGPRYPERVSQALAWDLTLRRVDGRLLILPQSAVVPGSRAALSGPITGQTFETMIEAPGQSTFRADSIPLTPGQLLAVRSRDLGSGCVVFAKIQAVTVNVAEGSAHFRLVANGTCNDPRLTTIE